MSNTPITPAQSIMETAPTIQNAEKLPMPPAHDINLVLDNRFIDLLSNLEKQDVIDILSALKPLSELTWLQSHQTFAAGLCAIVTALIAYAGVCYASGNQLKIEEKKHERAQEEKRSIWERKKRFFVFDVINATTEVEKYVEYISRHITNVDEDEAHDEYYVFRTDLSPSEQCDVYFEKVYELLDRVSIKKSAYPINDNEIQYLSDKEMEVLNDLGFRVEFLKSKAKEIQEICRRLLKSWVPEGIDYDKDFQRFIQDDAHKLVKTEVKSLVTETAKIGVITIKLANIFAPEIGGRFEHAKRMADKIRAQKENQ